MRYIIVQMLAYGIDMGVFLLAVSVVGVGPLPANIVSKVCAGFFAFLMHRQFTFRLQESQYDRTQPLKYFLLLGLNVPLATVLLWFVLTLISHAVIAKVLSDIAIIFINFMLSRHWVYRTKL